MRNCLRREIVGRGSETPRANDDPIRRGEALQGGDDARAIVVDDAVFDDLETHVDERRAEPSGIRIDELTARELGADAEECAGHGDGRTDVVATSYAQRKPIVSSFALVTAGR